MPIGDGELLSGAVSAAKQGKTVVVLSGGNVDPHVLAAVINRHQTGIGRRLRFFTRVDDRPGGLATFLAAVATEGGNVLELTHVRDGVALRVGEVGLEILVETRGDAHGEKLLEGIRLAGYPCEQL